MSDYGTRMQWATINNHWMLKKGELSLSPDLLDDKTQEILVT